MYRNILLFTHVYLLPFFLLNPSIQGQSESETVRTLDPFIATGTVGPTQASETIVPVTLLSGDELTRSLASSLGETLEGQLGIHASSFGAGASRPIIRGFEGPRIRVLESGLDSLDVSDTSPDHAVSIEPFFAESIEVVRGPSTLLYGSSAIGGVVNVIDNRIPRERKDTGVTGQFEGRHATVSEGWDGMGRAEVHQPSFSVSLSGLKRDYGNYEIPGFAESAGFRAAEAEESGAEAEEEEAFGVLENSFVETESGSIALSWFPSEENRLSFAAFALDSLYGVPGHSEEEGEAGEEGEEEEGAVSIDLEQRRYDLDGEFVFNGPWAQSLRFRFNYADYVHQELEGDEIGTRFDREGWETRLELNHSYADKQAGILGLQLGDSDFDAEGEEAFAPPSSTLDLAFFALEEWTLKRVSLQGGLRLERRDIDVSSAISPGYEDWAWSASAGVLVPLGNGINAALNLSRSERHPTAVELFSDGPHVATQQFEVGDSTLGTETAHGADASIKLFEGPVTGQFTVFYNRFNNYIDLSPTGEEEDGLPVFQFRSTDAEFYGVETELNWHVRHGDTHNFDITATYDTVRAVDTDNNRDLPRIPPHRIGLRALYSNGPWKVGSGIRYAFEQDRVTPNELPTDSYADWSASLSHSFQWDSIHLTAFVEGRNLLDDEIRHHTSFLKDVAPQPGRNVVFGVHVHF